MKQTTKEFGRSNFKPFTPMENTAKAKTFNAHMLTAFYNAEKSLRRASTFRYWTWYAKSLYWMADRAENCREYFSQQKAKEVLHG